MADFAEKAHIFIHKEKGPRPIVEVQVPAGTGLDVSRKLESMNEAARPRFCGCPARTAAPWLRPLVKERFEDGLCGSTSSTMDIVR